jgi:hypothetical protein
MCNKSIIWSRGDNKGNMKKRKYSKMGYGIYFKIAWYADFDIFEVNFITYFAVITLFSSNFQHLCLRTKADFFFVEF